MALLLAHTLPTPLKLGGLSSDDTSSSVKWEGAPAPCWYVHYPVQAWF